jgi:hypothetical protein
MGIIITLPLRTLSVGTYGDDCSFGHFGGISAFPKRVCGCLSLFPV